MATLAQIRGEIEDRVTSIRSTHPWWPCAAGCGDCCRQLARPLELPDEEWAAIEAAFAALPTGVRADVLRRARASVEQHARGAPRVPCPFLDDDDGMCRIYAARPAMCRAYGYYAARAGGGHCELVEREVQARSADDVLWGSLDALERALPPRVPLAAWLQRVAS